MSKYCTVCCCMVADGLELCPVCGNPRFVSTLELEIVPKGTAARLRDMKQKLQFFGILEDPMVEARAWLRRNPEYEIKVYVVAIYGTSKVMGRHKRLPDCCHVELGDTVGKHIKSVLSKLQAHAARIAKDY